jgi:hypothetical protein
MPVRLEPCPPNATRRRTVSPPSSRPPESPPAPKDDAVPKDFAPPPQLPRPPTQFQIRVGNDVKGWNASWWLTPQAAMLDDNVWDALVLRSASRLSIPRPRVAFRFARCWPDADGSRFACAALAKLRERNMTRATAANVLCVDVQSRGLARELVEDLSQPVSEVRAAWLRRNLAVSLSVRGSSLACAACRARQPSLPLHRDGGAPRSLRPLRTTAARRTRATCSAPARVVLLLLPVRGGARMRGARHVGLRLRTSGAQRRA